jgi:replicative DNA helicase
VRDTIANEEAERSVIGSCLVGEGKIDDIIDYGVRADWLYCPKNRMIFEAVFEMASNGDHIDLLTLGEKLSLAGALDQCGGYEYLEGCIDATPTAEHWEYYSEIVKDKHDRRQVIQCAEDAVDACQTDASPIEIIANLSSRITDIITHETETSPADDMDDNIQVLDNAYNGIVSGIPLPWPKFSSRIGGLQKASVIPLVGRDGKGKSGALAQIIDFNVQNSVPTLCFSFEDVKRRLLLRMGGVRMHYSAFGVETGMSLTNGVWGKMCLAEKQGVHKKMVAYKEIIDEAARKGLFHVYDKKMTVEEVVQKIRHHHRVHKIECATIDGFKDILHSKGDGRTACEKHIAEQLQNVAKECNLAMPVVSHINKIDEGVMIGKIHVTGAGEQVKGARQVLIFQDAGNEKIEEDNLFAMCAAKANFARGGDVILRRDESVLVYTEQ